MTDEATTAARPGEIPLRFKNIGPNHDWVDLGGVPYGLTEIQGGNESGKSRFLEALLATAIPKLEPGMVSLADGATSGQVTFGAVELRLSLTPEDLKHPLRVERRSANAEGPIVNLPDPIETLVDADHLAGEDARRRRRLRALAEFLRVSVDEERLRLLAGSPLDPPNDDLAGWLIERHSVAPFATLIDGAEAYAGARGELNKRALAAERDGETAEHEVSARRGSLGGVLRATAAALGKLGDDHAALLEIEQTLAAFEGDEGSARERHLESIKRLSTLRAAAANHRAEMERRERLRQGHGAPPDLLAAQNAVSVATTETERLDAELDAARAARDVAGEATIKRKSTWLESLIGEVQAAELALAEARGNLDRGRADVEREVAEERSRANNAVGEAARALEEAQIREGVAVSAFHDTKAALNQWSSVEAELNRSLSPPPSEQEINDEEERAGQSLRDEMLARSAASYRAAVEARNLSEERRDAIQATAKRLREEVVEVWRRLGGILNTAMAGSDTLRVTAEGSIECQTADGSWRDINDTERVSKGTLRQAALRLFLELARPGQTVVVSEEVMLLIQPLRRRALSGLARDRRLRLLFENPSDDATPRLFFYEPLTFSGSGVPYEPLTLSGSIESEGG